MTTCIYCKSNTNTFDKREHVIPQAFGTFNNNFTLINVVCDKCNANFGGKLELHFARDSLEGYIDRIMHLEGRGAVPHKRRRIVLKVAEGPQAGVYVEPTKDMKIKPLPQIGLKRKDGCWDYFLADDIPAINKDDYVLAEKDLIAYELSPEDAKECFQKISIKFEYKGELDPPNEEKALVDVKTEIDLVIKRCIAKIAFNYFAYHNNDIALLLNSSFDPIRNYVLEGIGTVGIKIQDEAILVDERGSNTRKLGHIITIDKGRYNNILVNLALFNNIHYTVEISNATPSSCNLDIGHFFDISSKDILPLKASVIQIPSFGLIIPTLWLPK